MAPELTDRQQEILTFIKRYTQKAGMPPTVQDIMKEFGFKSPNAVTSHINALERRGAIKKREGRHRGIVPLGDGSDDMIRVPLVGDVKAGVPMVSSDTVEDSYMFPKFIAREDGVFLMRVSGDSMINLHIQEGDYLLVKPTESAKNGDIVVAIVYNDDTGSDDVTVKRYFQEKNRIRLQPENDEYEPIYATSVRITGIVIGVIRLAIH